MKKYLIGALGTITCLTGGGVLAAEGIALNGFMTTGATYLDSVVSTQDGNITNKAGYTEDSRIGIQLTAQVNPKVDVTGQLLARANDAAYDMKADWAFVTYHVTDPLSIRAGKVKLSTFLISDYIEVGYAYPWIRAPKEVYTSNPISSINGVDILWRFSTGQFNFLVQPYVGASRGAQAVVPQEQIPSLPNYDAAGTDPLGAHIGDVLYTDFSAERMAGINISIGTDFLTLRGGYLATEVTAPSFGVADDTAIFTSGGLTMDWRNIVFYGEYFAREIEDHEGQSSANMAFPNQKGYYTTLGYRIGKVLPHITYAKLTDNNNPTHAKAGTPLEQVSKTAGLRIELGSGAALKLEAQQVTPKEGTRGLLISDPNASTLEDPSKSVNIYSVGVDVIF